MLNKLYILLILTLSTGLFSGCASARKAAIPTAGLPLVQEKAAQSVPAGAKNKSGASLSLQEAISLALERNPELQTFKMEIKAREARTFQESRLPNPQLMIEVENIAGSGPFSGLKGAETTIGIGQLIEFSGKRSKRVKIAALQSDLALWQYEIKRLDIITQVRSLYLQVLTAQKKMNLDRKLVELARTFKANVDTLVKGGRLSSAETARAQVELSNRELGLRQSKREFNNSRQLLAALWGANGFDFKQVEGTLESSVSIPSAQQVLQILPESPLLTLQNTVIKKQKAETDLADAQAIPDPVFSTAYRRFNESRDQALVAGLSIPLPFFDRNQGGQQEARYRERQSEQRLQNLNINLNAEINTRLEIMHSLTNEIKTIQEIIIPQAQEAYRIIQQNYRLGKYSLIDVLDAQRQLFDAEGRYIQAQAGINLQIIELEGLLGRSLESL